MLLDERAESHNLEQRLCPTRVEGSLCPLAAWLAQHRRSAHPITAGGKNRSAEAAPSESATELASFDARVHSDLLHALVEEPHAGAIPPYPPLTANELGWRFGKG